MSKLNVGDNFGLPLDVITMATAILGLRGSGKTNTAGVWAEELLKKGQQVIVIDPQNVWWGLKSSADGKSPGFPVVIFGGDHADVPLVGTEGKVLADFVVEHRVPAIFSLRHLSLTAQRKFVTTFTEQLFFRKGEAQYQDPVLVIIDEAHKFVPQKVQGDDMAMLVHRIQMLVTEGRASGIGVTLIDQRAATVNKDVLTQLELMVVHRTVGPQDKKALDEWIRDNAEEGQALEFKQSLAALSLGQAWFWSVGWLNLFKRVQVRMRETFDSSATPRPGEKRITPKTLAEVNLDQLKTELSETVKKAEENDPKKLKAEIAVLRRDLEKAQKTIPQAVAQVATKTETVEVPIIPVKEIEALTAELTGFRKDYIGCLERIAQGFEALNGQKMLNQIEGSVGKLLSGIKVPVPARRPVASFSPSIERPKQAPPRKPVGDMTNSITDSSISKAAQKVLDALALCEKLGIENPERINVAFFAGYTVNGHFNNLVGSLRTNGFIDYPSGGRLCLTDAGRPFANPDGTPIDSLEQFHDLWRGKLGGPEVKILDVLLEYQGNAISRDFLAEKTGYTVNGHFNNCVGHLKTLGIAYYPSGGNVAATSVMFPEGLA